MDCKQLQVDSNPLQVDSKSLQVDLKWTPCVLMPNLSGIQVESKQLQVDSKPLQVDSKLESLYGTKDPLHIEL